MNFTNAIIFPNMLSNFLLASAVFLLALADFLLMMAKVPLI